MSERTTFTAWITKYALTKGVFSITADCDTSGKMIKDASDRWFTGYYHGEGKEWHRTKEGAVKRAEEMKAKKIASLKKSIERVKKLKFGD